MNGDPRDFDPNPAPWPLVMLGVIGLIGVTLIFIGLTGCGDEDNRTTVLPTVPVPEVLDAFVVCHDWDGVGPDKTFQRSKVEKSQSPRFCFVGDVCFYGCPR